MNVNFTFFSKPRKESIRENLKVGEVVTEVRLVGPEEEEEAKKMQGTLQGLDGQLDFFVTGDNVVVVVIANEVRKLELVPRKGQTVWIPPKDYLDLAEYQIGKQIKLSCSGRAFQLLPDFCVLDGNRFQISLLGEKSESETGVLLEGGRLQFWIGSHRPWLCPTLLHITFTHQSTSFSHLLLGDGVGRLVEVAGQKLLAVATASGEVTVGGERLVEGRQRLVRVGGLVWRLECQRPDSVTPPSHWAFRGVVKGAPVDERMVDALYSRDREQFDEEKEEKEEGLVGRKWFPLEDAAWVLNHHKQLRHNAKKRKSESSVSLPSAKKHVPESIW